MKLRKHFHNDLNRYPTPPRDRVLGRYAPAEAAPYTPAHRPRKKWLTAPMAVAMALILTFGVAAAGVSVVRYLNRDVITENAVRLTEVPEGYVGIYSVADLVQMAEDVRNGTNAQNYILMNDITFTDADYAAGGICEGGWVPLDTYHFTTSSEQPYAYQITHSFRTFNGNGHVIRNLKITAPAENMRDENRYIGLFGCTTAEIIHLGIEDCEIMLRETVTEPFLSYDAAEDIMIGLTVHVGAVAGCADYVGGCYVNGLNIDLTSAFAWDEENMSQKEQFADTAFYNLNVGGIAGSVTYVDACYAENVSIRVHTEGEPYAKLYAGVLAGRATSCVTSWAQGTVEISGTAYREQNTADIACNYPSHSFPTVIPKESFELLLDTVDQYYGKGGFNTKLIRAYFVLKDTNSLDTLSEEQQAALQTLVEGFNERYAFVSGDPETTYSAFYIFDPTSSALELERIGTLIAHAFETEEEYLDFCHTHNIRMGLLACYTLTPEQTVTESDLADFNFETLWTIVNGKPRLRIFAN